MLVMPAACAWAFGRTVRQASTSRVTLTARRNGETAARSFMSISDRLLSKKRLSSAIVILGRDIVVCTHAMRREKTSRKKNEVR